MSASSILTGQNALQRLPASSKPNEDSIASYELDSKLETQRKSLSSSTNDVGIEVLKVSKNGKLYPRRLAFSPDHRSLFVTTNRFKSVKGFFKYALQTNREVTARTIDLSRIDHLVRGQQTKRFSMARIAALSESSSGSVNNSGDAVMKLMLESESLSMSIVYRVPPPENVPGNINMSAITSGISSVIDGAKQQFQQHSSLHSHVSSHYLQQHQQSYDTLDLILPNQQTFETLWRALQQLIALHQEEQQRYARQILLLQLHWSDLGKSLNESMNTAEWSLLCDKLNLPLTKAEHVRVFKNYEKQLNEGEGMLFSYVGEILEDIESETIAVETKDPCDIIWNDIVATDPIPAVKLGRAEDDASLELLNDDDDEEETISAVAFLSFIRSQQKDFSASLEDAVELIHTLNNQVSWDVLEGNQRFDVTEDTRIASLDRLGKSRFINFIMSDFNDIFQPNPHVSSFSTAATSSKSISASSLLGGKNGAVNGLYNNRQQQPHVGLDDGVPADDMSLPLTDYWIHTSHDTYLAKMPGYAFSIKGSAEDYQYEATDEQMYLYALERGVRCLELDLWDGITGEPVVARSQPNGTTDHTIPLAVILRHIRSFLKYNPNVYPILLRMENHCSYAVQEKLALQVHKILGSYLAQPIVDEVATLPSPEDLKGKVVIMGKRPAPDALTMENGRSSRDDNVNVLHDDYDEENDASNEKLYQSFTYDEEECDDMNQQYVIGFNSSGPITATRTASTLNEYHHSIADNHFCLNEQQKEPSLNEVLKEAIDASELAKQEASLAEARAARLQFEAAEAEKLAAQLTQEAGLTPAQVKASAAAPRNNPLHNGQGVEVSIDASQAGPHDEGLEVQEFLHDEVKGSRNIYSSVIAEAIEASEVATLRLSALNETDAALREAESNLYLARQKEKDLAEQSRRAAVEARCNREHAESAQRRVTTVRELLRKCEENANSARTVVVTATTEAKISERRATEAEARAARATTSAERDRARADDETKKEERLEEEASQLHSERTEAANVAQLAKERLEKAVAMLEKVDEQINLIEKSPQFKKEVEQCPNYREGEMTVSDLLAYPFLAKHADKIEEANLCKDLIKEASNENSKADNQRRTAQEKFEEKAQMWKIQADIAGHVRKQADRSSLVAEELAEHAEEERDAATLRHVAREKAEANVEQRNAHLESVQAQLAEAERAASEAATLVVESRKRADSLAKDADAATHYSSKMTAVETCKAARERAAAAYDAARIVKEEKDAVASETKRLLETNAEVYTSAVRDAAAESHRANSERLLERKAIIAYNRAILTRKQADHAKALAKIALATSQEKAQAARQAQEYSNRRSRISSIPMSLARVTSIHTTRHKCWEKTLSMPTYFALSMAQQSLAVSYSKDPRTTRRKMIGFTKSHLCRVFPSCSSSCANVDPVLSWSLGCQLISTNLHRPDENFLVAEGRFRQNGSCGYVLKPEALLKTSSLKGTNKEQRWSIRILRGSYLPKLGARHSSSHIQNSAQSRSCISPFVKVVVHDGDGSVSNNDKHHKTRTVPCNGLNPVWDERDGFEFAVTRPWVSMISIVVYDETASGKEDFVAGAAIPISHLRQGYRSVALFDSSHTRSGPFAFASLLVNCQKLS